MDVVAEHDLRKYFHVNSQVIGASWDDAEGVWHVRVKNLTTGDEFTDTAEIFVNNEGLLK